MIGVQFVKLDERAQIPRNAYGNDAGWDLFCLEDTHIPAEMPIDVRTGIAIALPDGYFGRIVHRSSAPRKRRIMVLEGIIDAGFRGELFSCAYCIASSLALDGHGHPYETGGVDVRAGDSIAQIIIQEVRPVVFEEVDVLPESVRGTKGFGSSGL